MNGKAKTIEELIELSLPKARELAVDDINVDIEASFAIQQLYKSEFSMKISIENQVSVQNALFNLVSIGISLNPASKHAYLVPRRGAIVLDISYMGLMSLAQRTGSIEWTQATIVKEEDTYKSLGVNVAPLHEYEAFGDRGLPVGVYCIAKLLSGDYLTEEMTKSEVMVIKKASMSATKSDSPWVKYESEMWRKCAVKRASKYWPTSESGRLEKAVHVINQHEGVDFNATSSKSDPKIYPQEEFERNLPEWEKIVLEGKKNPETMLEFLSSRLPLSDEQMTIISKIGEKNNEDS